MAGRPPRRGTKPPKAAGRRKAAGEGKRAGAAAEESGGTLVAALGPLLGLFARWLGGLWSLCAGLRCCPRRPGAQAVSSPSPLPPRRALRGKPPPLRQAVRGTQEQAPAEATLAQLTQLLFRDGGKASFQDAFVDYLQPLAARGVPSGVLELLVLRGPPGLGKSSFAAARLEEAGKTAGRITASGGLCAAERLAHICSTDDLFTSIGADGAERYCYNARRVAEYHGQNQERVRLCMLLGVSPLFVDNTNLSRWEMRPYLELADAAGYRLEIVEPWQLHKDWNCMKFLKSRNEQRAATGKRLDPGLLRRMLLRFEPLPPGDARRWLCGATTCRPLYCGVDVDEALKGRQLGSLWSCVAGALSGHVSPQLLNLQDYVIPERLHVTTFYRTEVHGCVWADSLLADGAAVAVSVEAVALVAGCLACALVSRLEPPVPAPPGKRLHVTLGTRPPWRPAQSNDLLQALLPEGLRGEAPDGGAAEEPRGDEVLQPSAARSVAASWPKLGGVEAQSGSRPEAEAPREGPKVAVRAFAGLRLPGQPRAVDAFLVRLARPVELRGKRFMQRQV